MNPARHVMFSRRLSLAAALLAGLGAATALAQGPYYPASNSPLDNNAALAFIEANLAAPLTTTLVIPAPTGKSIATEADIDAALGAAVAAEIASNAFSGSVQDLVSAASKYRSSKITKFITGATNAALAEANDTLRESYLEQVAAGASGANAKGASKVVKSMLALVAKSTAATLESDDADDVVSAAIAAAEDFADQIVKGAVGGIKKAPSADLPGIMNSIAGEALDTIYDPAVDAPYLADEVAKQIGVTAKGLSGDYTSVGGLVTAIFGTVGNIPTTQEEVGLIAAGLMAGTQQATAVETLVNALPNAYGGHDAFVSQVQDGFTDANGSPGDAAIAAGLVDAGTTGANANFIAARIIGASTVNSGVATELVGLMLAKDRSLVGDDTVTQIVEAAVRGNQKKGPNTIANAIVGALGAGQEANARGQVAQGAAQGLDGHPLYNVLLRSAIIKAVKTDGTTGANLSEIAQFGSAGSISSGNVSGIADVAFGATKASKLPNEVVAGVVAGATGANSDEQWRGLLGAMAADKKNAAAIRTTAYGLGGWDDATNGDTVTSGPAVQGGDAIIDMHTNKKNYFNFSLKALRDTDTDTDVERLAVLTAAGLINAKNTQAVAATLLAEAPSISEADVRALALDLNPKAAAGVNRALDAASQIKANPNNIFEIVDHLTQQNPKQGVDIATGAAAFVPGQAHLVTHASAFRNPGKVGKAITAVFGVTLRDDNGDLVDDDIDNTVAAASAIGAAAVCGILEAKTGTKEESNIKGAAAAAVKAAILLTGNGSEGAGLFRQSDGGVGTFTLTTQKGAGGVATGVVSQFVKSGDLALPATAIAALGAMAKTAKAYALEIAQAAGQAARAIAGAGFTGVGAIASAISTNSGVALVSVTNAVNFGISEAAGGTLGAGAAGVVNYTHFNCTGAPVTSIFDL